jgi:hypothetical protein
MREFSSLAGLDSHFVISSGTNPSGGDVRVSFDDIFSLDVFCNYFTLSRQKNITRLIPQENHLKKSTLEYTNSNITKTRTSRSNTVVIGEKRCDLY